MKKPQSGFTLIELIVVVAIISILGVIALPTYMDYTIRSKITEGIGLSAPVKVAVSEAFITAGKFYAANNANYGLPASASISGEYVDNIAVGASGVITITYATVGGAANQKTVMLTPVTVNYEAAVSWDCSPGTMPDRYLPQACR